jgi:hypothetical protein
MRSSYVSLPATAALGREFNLEFKDKKPTQLGRRISNDQDVILEPGFEIDSRRKGHSKDFEY